jgi:hypothetical protein
LRQRGVVYLCVVECFLGAIVVHGRHIHTSCRDTQFRQQTPQLQTNNYKQTTTNKQLQTNNYKHKTYRQVHEACAYAAHCRDAAQSRQPKPRASSAGVVAAPEICGGARRGGRCGQSICRVAVESIQPYR